MTRSPWHKDMHQMLAWAHWTAGVHGAGAEGLKHLELALRSFSRSRELGHLEPTYYFAEADALKILGQSYAKAGRAREAESYAGAGARIQSEGEALQQKRWSLGLQ